MATKKSPIPRSRRNQKPSTMELADSRSSLRVESWKERFRAQYPEVHGKIVDFISHEVQDGMLYVTVWFEDHTRFSVRYRCDMVLVGAEFGQMKKGNLKVIREYPNRVPR